MILEIKEINKKAYLKEFLQFPISIGRLNDNSLSFPDSLKMSRYHAIIKKENSNIILTDLQSHSGTYINDVAINEEQLNVGTIFVIDKVEITVKEDKKLEKKIDNNDFETLENCTEIIELEANKTEAVSEESYSKNPIAIPLNKNQAKEFEIPDGESSVGRLPNNDLVIDSTSVSRRHCMLNFSNGLLTTTDLKSKNGTCVNGKKIKQSHAIKNGDILKFGNCEFKIKWPEKNKSATTENNESSGNYTEVLPQNFSANDSTKNKQQTSQPNFMFIIGAVSLIIILAGATIFPLLSSKTDPKPSEISEKEKWSAGQIIENGKEKKAFRELEYINSDINIDKLKLKLEDIKYFKIKLNNRINEIEISGKKWIESTEYKKRLKECEKSLNETKELYNKIVSKLKNKQSKLVKNINRKTKEPPTIQELIENGKLNLSNAKSQLDLKFINKAENEISRAIIKSTNLIHKIIETQKKIDDSNELSELLLQLQSSEAECNQLMYKLEQEKENLSNKIEKKEVEIKLSELEFDAKDYKKVYDYGSAIEKIKKALEIIKDNRFYIKKKAELKAELRNLTALLKRKKQLKIECSNIDRNTGINYEGRKKEMYKDIIDEFNDVSFLDDYKKALKEYKKLLK